MSGSTGEILEEYLIKLGYSTDLISLRKFEDGLTSTTKKILKVGGTVGAVVASVEAATAKFAYSMRKTYYTADLAGSSVKGLQSLSFAAKQFGIETGDMESGVKSFAQTLRLNPGMKAYVESFGVKVEGRDVSDVAHDFMKEMSKKPQWIGSQIASQFGIGSDLYHVWSQNIDKIGELRDRQKQLFKDSGMDPDAYKKTLTDYTTELDTLSFKLKIFGAGILTTLAPNFKEMTGLLNNSIDWWIKFTKQVDEGTVALEDFTAVDVLGFIKSVLPNSALKDNLFDAVIAAVKAPEKGVKQESVVQKIAGVGSLNRNEDSELAKKWVNPKPYISPPKATGAGVSTPEPAKPATATPGPLAAPVAPAAKGVESSRAALNERNNNPGNIRYGNFAIRHGAIGENKGFAVFPNMTSGFTAAQELLTTYGKQGLNTIEQVISKWAPATENDTKGYAAHVAKKMGKGVNEPLNMKDPKTLIDLSKHIAKFEGLSGTALGAAEQTRLGAAAGNTVVTQTNNVNINVTGNGADATAKAVASAQGRVLGDAVRTLKGSTS